MGYSLLEMRPMFASTSDPSGSRRATNRVTARDPRPKKPGSLPFLPSFLPYALPPCDSSSLTLSCSLSLTLPCHPSALASTTLATLVAVIGFFLCSLAGRYNRGGLASRGLASRSPSRWKKVRRKEREKRGEERERGRQKARKRANHV